MELVAQPVLNVPEPTMRVTVVGFSVREESDSLLQRDDSGFNGVMKSVSGDAGGFLVLLVVAVGEEVADGSPVLLGPGALLVTQTPHVFCPDGPQMAADGTSRVSAGPSLEPVDVEGSPCGEGLLSGSGVISETAGLANGHVCEAPQIQGAMDMKGTEGLLNGGSVSGERVTLVVAFGRDAEPDVTLQVV
ncbi:hypothetical protein [Streptomyces sp. NPDC002851]